MLSRQEGCLHLGFIDEVRIQKGEALYSWWYDGDYWPEHDACAIFKHPDGSFGVFREGEDSTGHGCRCSATVDWFPTLEDAVRHGLSMDERNEFNRRNSVSSNQIIPRIVIVPIMRVYFRPSDQADFQDSIEVAARNKAEAELMLISFLAGAPYVIDEVQVIGSVLVLVPGYPPVPPGPQ